MILDDGATDGEADPHAVILSCVERLEKSVRRQGVEAGSGVPHAQAHAFVLVPFGSDEQMLRVILDAAHGVKGVQE